MEYCVFILVGRWSASVGPWTKETHLFWMMGPTSTCGLDLIARRRNSLLWVLFDFLTNNRGSRSRNWLNHLALYLLLSFIGSWVCSCPQRWWEGRQSTHTRGWWVTNQSTFQIPQADSLTKCNQSSLRYTFTKTIVFQRKTGTPTKSSTRPWGPKTRWSELRTRPLMTTLSVRWTRKSSCTGR